MPWLRYPQAQRMHYATTALGTHTHSNTIYMQENDLNVCNSSQDMLQLLNYAFVIVTHSTYITVGRCLAAKVLIVCYRLRIGSRSK